MKQNAVEKYLSVLNPQELKDCQDEMMNVLIENVARYVSFECVLNRCLCG
jgi:hypothetical protein